MIGNRRAGLLSINIVDANSIGPIRIVPTHFESPLVDLELTLLNYVLLLLIRYTNQNTKGIAMIIPKTLLSTDSTDIKLSPRRRF